MFGYFIFLMSDMNNETDKEYSSFSILLVDDESNILKSLMRLFKKDGYKICTAENGEEALALCQNKKFDLVVSDVRMPGMGGVELLEKIKEISPDTIRILLTGFAEISSIIDAVNRSNIYRYVAKPWDDVDFRLTVKGALKQKFLENEHVRLVALTKKQNEELKLLNDDLEEKVKHRTKKISNMMTELESANTSLRKSYLSIVKSFSSLIDSRSSLLEGHSRRVAELARNIAKKMSFTDKEIQDIFLAGLLHDIGKVGLSDNIINKPDSMLSKAEQDKAKFHAFWGEALLMGIEPLNNVSRFIRYHHEKYDGTGYPDQLKSTDIPIESRILSVANDFDALKIGTMSTRKYTKEEALKFIVSHKDDHYDPEIVKVLVAIHKQKEEEEKNSFDSKLELHISELKPGMVIARDIVTKERMLLLARGHVINIANIDKLKALEKTLNEIIKVTIKFRTVRYD